MVYNRNTLLDIYPAADGVKNGFTTEAGNCLVSSATVNGRRLIGVVLNCSDMYNTSQAMLEEAFDEYETVQICAAGEVKGEVAVENGKLSKVAVKTAAALDTLLKSGTEQTFEESIQLPDVVSAPVYDGKVLGTITYTDADGFSVSTDLIAAEPVSLHKFGLIWQQVWESIWQVFIVPIIK